MIVKERERSFIESRVNVFPAIGVSGLGWVAFLGRGGIHLCS